MILHCYLRILLLPISVSNLFRIFAVSSVIHGGSLLMICVESPIVQAAPRRWTGCGNQEGSASIRSSLETCIRLGKYALPICAQVAAVTATRSLQKLLLQLLTVCLQNWSSSHVFSLLESSGFTKSRSFTLFFSFVDAFRTTLITLTTWRFFAVIRSRIVLNLF
jgi:hypothetical protein